MRKIELVAVALLTLLQFLLVFSDASGPLRIATGFLFVSFLPGYCLLAAFYRLRRKEFGAFEHVALSIPVSLAINAVSGVAANELHLGLDPEAYVTWMGGLILLLSILAFLQNAKPGSGSEAGSSVFRYLPYIGGLFIVALMLNIPLSFPGARRPGSALSLSILGSGANPHNYPREVLVNEPFELRIEVNNGEAFAQDLVLVSSTGTVIPLHIGPGRKWQAAAEIRLAGPGLQRVTWSLTHPGAESPARSIHLWVNAR